MLALVVGYVIISSLNLKTDNEQMVFPSSNDIGFKQVGDVVVPEPDKIYPRTRESYELKYLKK